MKHVFTELKKLGTYSADIFLRRLPLLILFEILIDLPRMA
jgi:hypothetical protein